MPAQLLGGERQTGLAFRVLRGVARRLRRLIPLRHYRQRRWEQWEVERVLGRLGRSRRNWQQECDHLREMRLKHLRQVTEPLVLISQIQRSGGTLLSQLFDMHPEIHAHPYELYIGYPGKMDWPRLDPQASPDAWFRILFESPVLKGFYNGYTKYGRGTEDAAPDFPFLFLPSLQKAIFEQCAARRTIRTDRDVLNCYMTSYFNAWLDNQNLYGPAKKYITAFVPRMSMGHSLDRFFTAYPDGRLISLVREPKSWYVSARKHEPRVYGDQKTAIDLWLTSTTATVQAKVKYGERVQFVRFESLVRETPAVMKQLADWLGIEYASSLEQPTFNGFPILADSSFHVSGHGVIQDPLHRHRTQLSSEESAAIDRQTNDMYAEISGMCLSG